MPKKDKQALLSEVHTRDKLVKLAALVWTVENLGQSWPEISSTSQLLEMHMDGVEPEREGEMEESLNDEYDYWKEHAKQMLERVEAKELPLTMDSMERAFSGELK